MISIPNNPGSADGDGDGAAQRNRRRAMWGCGLALPSSILWWSPLFDLPPVVAVALWALSPIMGVIGIAFCRRARSRAKQLDGTDMDGLSAGSCFRQCGFWSLLQYSLADRKLWRGWLPG